MKVKIYYIIIGLLVIIFIQGFFSVPKGITEEEELYRLKIHDLNQEKVIQLEIINNLQNKINSFKDEKNKIDSITDGYSNNQLDSFYTDFFK